MRVNVRGPQSNWTDVLSRIPHGSVLGSVLFLIFVNNILDYITITTSILIFADDTKLWTTISGADDSTTLQQNLDNLAQWSNKWLLRFTVMHIVHVKCPKMV